MEWKFWKCCFEIKSCTCCGITVPVHSDSVVTHLTKPTFKVTYLSTKFFSAFKCTCTKVCFGEQYYSINSPKQKEFYFATHPGNINTFPSEPNAELCEVCHWEIQCDLTKLHMARRFSRCNGYGPIPVPWFHGNMTSQEELAYELDNLL